MDPTPPLPGVPRGFEQVVARCLEKDPNRRFANVSQLAAALAPFGSTRIAEAAVDTATKLSMSGSQPILPARTPDARPTTLGSSAGMVTQPLRRSSRLRWGLVGLAAASAVAVALVKLRDEDAPATSQPGSANTVIMQPEPLQPQPQPQPHRRRRSRTMPASLW
jgi:hypothetical protein